MYQLSLSPTATSKNKNLSSLLKKNGVFLSPAERKSVFGTILHEATQLKDS